MGYAKQKWVEEMSRGWSSLGDQPVCAECFEDAGIQDFIRDNADETECSYCERESESPIAVSVDAVIEHILDSLRIEWGDVDQECVPYDSSEGGYQVVTPVETYDLLFRAEDIGATGQELRQDILNAIHTGLWCQHDWQILSAKEQLRVSWENFVSEIKHRRRYLFSIPNGPDEDEEGVISPAKMLDELGRLIRALGRVSLWPADTEVYRARPHEAHEYFTSATDLGTAPQHLARQANRMSPAGIPMFYGAMDPNTALLEVFDPKGPLTATVAKFRTKKAFFVVDLTSLPYVPSLYDARRRGTRAPIAFLRDLVRDLTKQIERDGREHTEYVPTQVVTEYFRHEFRTADDDAVKGIVYPSARESGGTACVLFFGNAECGGDRGGQFGTARWLEIEPASLTRHSLPAKAAGGA